MNDIKGYYFNLLDDDESDKVIFFVKKQFVILSISLFLMFNGNFVNAFIDLIFPF